MTFPGDDGKASGRNTCSRIPAEKRNAQREGAGNLWYKALALCLVPLVQGFGQEQKHTAHSEVPWLHRTSLSCSALSPSLS